jgi:hypothetical protein
MTCSVPAHRATHLDLRAIPESFPPGIAYLTSTRHRGKEQVYAYGRRYSCNADTLTLMPGSDMFWEVKGPMVIEPGLHLEAGIYATLGQAIANLIACV